MSISVRYVVDKMNDAVKTSTEAADIVDIHSFDLRGWGLPNVIRHVAPDYKVRGKASEPQMCVSGDFWSCSLTRISWKQSNSNLVILRIATILSAVPGATDATIVCENVPRGIRPMTSNPKNLGAFIECGTIR